MEQTDLYKGEPGPPARRAAAPETLGHSTAWNLVGSAVPLLIGLAAIPVILEGLGVERFGLLTLAWLIVGYFSLFDLGLSRALTKVVAEYRGKGQEEDVPVLFWTSITMMLVLGIVGAVLMWYSAGLLVNVISVSGQYRAEATAAVQWLAICLPVIIVSAGLRGMLEAYQQFRVINLIKIPFAAGNYLVPIVILFYGGSLSAVVLGAVASRVILLIVYAVAVGKVVGHLRFSPQWDGRVARELLRFGGWMTVTNIIGPVMVYMDSFVVGAVLTAAVVAYYTIPYEISTKLWILPGSIIAALFPLLSARLNSDKAAAHDIFFRALKFLFAVIYPLVFLLVCFSREGLEYWLGAEFADNSSLILQLLFAGVFVNSIAMFSFALLQSSGHPRATAIIHMLELPFYLVLLLYLLATYGVVGAALAWLTRVTVDSFTMSFVAYRHLPEFTRGLRRVVGAQLLALASFALVLLVPWVVVKILLCAGVFGLSLLWIGKPLYIAARGMGGTSFASLRSHLFET